MDFKFNSYDTTFNKKICKKINKNMIISKNTDLFIKEKKLIKLDLPKNTKEEELPLQSYIGTCYLIKNNSIIEISSSFICKKNHILDDNEYLVYKTIVKAHNLDRVDISNFKDDIFLDIDNLISYSSKETISFIYALFQVGFNIWIRSI